MAVFNRLLSKLLSYGNATAVIGLISACGWHMDDPFDGHDSPLSTVIYCLGVLAYLSDQSRLISALFVVVFCHCINFFDGVNIFNHD